MRARSWMAALALIAGTTIAVGRAMPSLDSSAAAGQDQGQAADDKKAESTRSKVDKSNKDTGQDSARNDKTEETRPRPGDAKRPGGSGQSVLLTLIIAGLGREGCDIEVKPGNASCKFRAVNEHGKEGNQHVSSAGKAKLELRDVELRGADRTCSVAITVRETGRPPKTIYRGFRLTSQANSTKASPTAPPSSVVFYLRSPSKIVRADEAHSRK